MPVKQISQTQDLTKKAKNFLLSYVNLQRELDLKIERLSILEQRIREKPAYRPVDSPDALQRDISEHVVMEADMRGEILRHMENLRNPEERAVIQLRYLDRFDWVLVCAGLYYAAPDFETNTGRYMKKMFRMHGRALAALSASLNMLEMSG